MSDIVPSVGDGEREIVAECGWVDVSEGVAVSDGDFDSVFVRVGADDAENESEIGNVFVLVADMSCDNDTVEENVIETSSVSDVEGEKPVFVTFMLSVSVSRLVIVRESLSTSECVRV
jgi:alpha-D-ribose 1-methylphosphonate 5-phosphate C-P lyase